MLGLAVGVLVSTFYFSRGMWKQQPTAEKSTARETGPASKKEREPDADRGASPDEPRSGVKDLPLDSGDPASAGVKRRFLWTVTASERGWIPAGDLSDASISGVIRLEGGTAYNLCALTRPHSSVEFSFFRAGMTREPEGFTVDPDTLVAETGIDLYPAQDAVLRMRWQQPGGVSQPRLTLRVDLREETPEERQRERAVTDIAH